MAAPPEQAAAVPLALDRIRTDGGTQMRVDLNEDVVEEYSQTIRAGIDLPPIVVFADGSKHWLADGFHRFFGYKKAGAQTIQAEVRRGTKRDAILYSVGANASHGLRRTNEDKRKAALTLLKDKEWSKWSDREIARQAGVSHPLVSSLRSELSGNSSRCADAVRKVTRGGATFEQNTSNIGASKTVQDAADRAEALAEARRQREIEQAEHDRQREEARAALPDWHKQREAAKEAAVAARKENASPVDDPADDGDLTDADRIAELEEAVRTLEAEVARLEGQIKEDGELDTMRAEWREGGWDRVISKLKADHAEVFRVQSSRIERESRDKASWMRSAKYWQEQAHKHGYSSTATIDLGTGEIVDG